MLRRLTAVMAAAAVMQAPARTEPPPDPVRAAYVASMEGRKADTLAAVQELATRRPVEQVLAAGGSGWELTPQYSALVRFGLWDELIALLPPERRAPGLVAGYLYGRGVALAARGHLAEARASLAELEVLSADARLHRLVTVAAAVVAARIAASELHHEEAATRLRQAVAAEDGLPPAGNGAWFFPVRHLLGAELLSAGHAAEAERAYREDLERNPDNGWSLFGLAAALRAEGRKAEAADAERRFLAAWGGADVRLLTSAFWFPGPDTTQCECQRTSSADRQSGGELLGAQHEARVD